MIQGKLNLVKAKPVLVHFLLQKAHEGYEWAYAELFGVKSDYELGPTEIRIQEFSDPLPSKETLINFAQMLKDNIDGYSVADQLDYLINFIKDGQKFQGQQLI